jgi:hypothetical protein
MENYGLQFVFKILKRLKAKLSEEKSNNKFQLTIFPSGREIPSLLGSIRNVFVAQ